MNDQFVPPSSPLIDYLRQQMARKGWSANRLAEESGVSKSALSLHLRGMVEPETATLLRIAAALQVDADHLFKLVARSEGEGPFDPSAAYIARRLTELPQTVRDPAIDAVSGMVDAFTVLARLAGQAEQTPPLLDALQRFRQEHPDLFDEYFGEGPGEFHPDDE